MPAYTDPSVLEPFVPGEIDKADAFDGSTGETITHDGTTVASQGVEIGTSTATRPSDGAYGTSQDNGLAINPNTDIEGVSVTISGSTDAVTDLYIRDTAGNILQSKSVSATAGDTLDIFHNMSAGTTYWVTIQHNNQAGKYTSASYPYTSTFLDITGGVSQLSSDSGDAWAFSDVQALIKDATVKIEWSYPTDVYEWGGAYFDAALNGETVNVYVEEYDGSTWNEIAGPIASGDEIPGKPSRNVRFRVDFSRNSLSNNPRLLEVARREVFKSA